MPADSTAIDQALLDVLINDTTLRALLPDGVFFGAPGPSFATGKNSERFVLVSLIDAHDEPMFGGVAYEEILYAVQAVTLGRETRAAAARINLLLDGQTLSVADYYVMTMRRQKRTRDVETDALDNSIKWFWRGGHYQVVATPATVGTGWMQGGGWAQP